MKSIFKKIALVLALAMVVTMLPAKAASVAAADASANKWVRKTCTLYIDALEDDTIYVPAAYATAKPKVAVAKDAEDGWGTLGYSVSFESADENVAVVGERYGLVEAVGIGQTTVTATFTKDGAATVTESFPVTVKRAAASVALDEETEKAVNSLVVGNDPVVLKAVMTDADGNQELVEKTTAPGKLSVLLAEGRKYVTDYLKFEVKNPEDKEVLKYDAEKNELTAVAEGEATLNVVAYRYDWKATAKTKTKYAKTRTAEKAYTVTVKAAGIVSAKQVNWNTVALTCENAKAAEDIVANKEKITVTYKLDDKDITTYINYTEVKVDSSDNKVVLVSLYDNLVKDYEYTFKYGENAATIRGVDLTAVVSIEVATRIIVYGQYKEIDVKYYDSNHVELPKNQFSDNTRIEATGGDSNYFDLNSNNQIYFTESNKSAIVKAIYTKGYKDDGTADEIISPSVTIHSVDEQTENEKIVGWVIKDVNVDPGDWEYSTGVKDIAIGDTEQTGKQLYGKYTATKAEGGSSNLYTHKDGIFEYTSTNDSVLVVDKATGEIYPVAAGTATIIVRRVYSDTNKPVVGTCEIRVAANRKLTSFSATPNKNKLSVNVGADSVQIATKVVDQLGKDDTLKATGVPSDLLITYTFKALGTWPEGLVLNITGDQNTSCSLAAKDDEGTANPAWNGFNVKATCTDATKLKNTQSVSFSITATQGNRASIKRVITLSVKQVTSTDAKRWELELGKSNIDMNIRAFQSWQGDGDLKSEIKLVAYDVNGFKVAEEALTSFDNGKQPVADGYCYAIFDKKGDNVTSARLDGSSFNAITVSSSAVTSPSAITKSITKCDTGVYTVKVFKDKNLFKQKNIVVNDSGANAIAVMVKDNQNADPSNLKDKFKFFKNGAEIPSWELGNYEVLPVDVKIVGNTFFVNKIMVRETNQAGNDSLKGATYEYEVNVGKTFYTN